MSSNYPTIFFVDDEALNREIFRISAPKNWNVILFSSGAEAIEAVERQSPAVVVSDQIMPGLNGIRFLELCHKISPLSTRILVTAYSEESLVIESVRSAKIFDYLKKPWETEDLISRILAGIEYHLTNKKRIELENELLEKQKILIEKNAELSQKTNQMTNYIEELNRISDELNSWIQPVVLKILKAETSFPLKKNLALISADIVDSSALHGKSIFDKSLKTLALEEFGILVLKHGGYLEVPAGDAGYANFGLVDSFGNPSDAALAVAFEFKAALKGISAHYQVNIDCGIGLHFGEDIEANISKITVNSFEGPITQKRFLTSSSHVDLVHRIEKLGHSLSGTNILFTKAFKHSLTKPPSETFQGLGEFKLKGQKELTPIFLIKDDNSDNAEIEKLKSKAATSS